MNQKGEKITPTINKKNYGQTKKEKCTPELGQEPHEQKTIFWPKIFKKDSKSKQIWPN